MKKIIYLLLIFLLYSCAFYDNPDYKVDPNYIYTVKEISFEDNVLLEDPRVLNYITKNSLPKDYFIERYKNYFSRLYIEYRSGELRSEIPGEDIINFSPQTIYREDKTIEKAKGYIVSVSGYYHGVFEMVYTGENTYLTNITDRSFCNDIEFKVKLKFNIGNDRNSKKN